MERIFLIGPPGAGKTACGQALAQKLSCDFYDTDHLIERDQGCKVAEIFAQHGEKRFRELERGLLEKMHEETNSSPSNAAIGLDLASPFTPALQAAVTRTVYATGGGLPIYNDNITLLATLGKVVALTADLSVLVDRVKSNTDRPLLAKPAESNDDKHLQNRISDLLRERQPVYERAGYRIDTSGLNPEQVADEIIRLIAT